MSLYWTFYYPISRVFHNFHDYQDSNNIPLSRKRKYTIIQWSLLRTAGTHEFRVQSFVNSIRTIQITHSRCDECSAYFRLCVWRQIFPSKIPMQFHLMLYYTYDIPYTYWVLFHTVHFHRSRSFALTISNCNIIHLCQKSKSFSTKKLVLWYCHWSPIHSVGIFD